MRLADDVPLAFELAHEETNNTRASFGQCNRLALLKIYATICVSPPDTTSARIAQNSMSVRIVRLGTPRARDEGTRIGTVRRPPRGVPKSAFASQDWYDVWFPTLAPSLETMKIGLAAATPAQWTAFTRKYQAEMKQPEAQHALALLAALSHAANFAVGCYCEDERRCHRSLLRQLLVAHGAKVA